MRTSQTLGRIGIALAAGYAGLRYFGVIGGDGSSSSGGSISTGGMESIGEDTTIEERSQRRQLFAGVEPQPIMDDTASDVDDEGPRGSPRGISTGNMAADGEDTTIEERGERRRQFAGVETENVDTTASDDTGSSTGNMEADSEDTTIEERGERRSRFAGSGSSSSSSSDSSSSDNDDYERAVEDNVGRDSGTGGVSGL